MKCGVWSRGWSQKCGIFLTTIGLKKKKALQNKRQPPPKKTTYCHPAKKSKCAEKTTTYGWVGCDRKEYRYHVLSIPFTDLSEKKFSRTEHGVVPKPVFSESTIGDRKSKEGFVPSEWQWRARNGISPLTQEWAEKNQSRQKRKRQGQALCFAIKVLLRLKQREKWNVLEHAHYQHQSHNIHR